MASQASLAEALVGKIVQRKSETFRSERECCAALTKRMKISWIRLLLTGGLLFAASANAAFVVNITQQGNDVVSRGSGSLNTGEGFEPYMASCGEAFINPSTATLCPVVSGASQPLLAISGPTAFGRAPRNGGELLTRGPSQSEWPPALCSRAERLHLRYPSVQHGCLGQRNLCGPRPDTRKLCLDLGQRGR